MRKIFIACSLLIIMLLLTATFALADPPTKHDAQGNEVEWAANSADSCTRIQEGTLVASDGSTITTGYDQYGYNYQAHMFNGLYCNYDRNSGDCGPDPGEGDQLMMKWNDAWLANTDCNGDGKLDRHWGFASYRGSGAWETNHMSGSYLDDAGQTCNWTYFVKIVAAPADATSVGGVWYAADGTEIGPVIWGEFATIQEVYNDPCGGVNGLQYLSPDHAGFGGW